MSSEQERHIACYKDLQSFPIIFNQIYCYLKLFRTVRASKVLLRSEPELVVCVLRAVSNFLKGDMVE